MPNRSLAVLLLGAATLLPLVPATASSCAPEPVHTYAFGGAAGFYSSRLVTASDGGMVVVADTNTLDCDGDGVPGDFDGDYETGIGGGFFGWGPYAAACGINVHGSNVVVTDIVSSDIAFVVGEDGPSAPVRERHFTKVEAEAYVWALEYFGYPREASDPEDHGCSSNGVIAPQVDSGDCLTTVFITTGTTCGGGGGDGGYWVFLLGVAVEDHASGITIRNTPTLGTIVAF